VLPRIEHGLPVIFVLC